MSVSVGLSLKAEKIRLPELKIQVFIPQILEIVRVVVKDAFFLLSSQKTLSSLSVSEKKAQYIGNQQQVLVIVPDIFRISPRTAFYSHWRASFFKNFTLFFHLVQKKHANKNKCELQSKQRKTTKESNEKQHPQSIANSESARKNSIRRT